MKPIPQEAIESLPDGFELLGWGGEFDINDSFYAVVFNEFNDGEWDELDWVDGTENKVFAAPHDSEIVELNRKAGKLPAVIYDQSGNGRHLYKSEDVLSQKEGSICDKTLLPQDDAERQKCRLFDYYMNYFPNAQIAKSVHSYDSNLKHTGTEGMEWASNKSIGDGNQIMRHLVEAFEAHAKGDAKTAQYHLTCLAWRGDELLERYITKMEPFDNDNT